STRLEQAGFRTASAYDAEQAFQALPNLSADLIILDLLLPKRGGVELLQAIRSEGRHKSTPVLLLSNAYLPEMAQKALKAGGNKALSRSECTSSELISISRELIGINGIHSSQEATSLTEQLQQDLLEAGSIEIPAIREHCLKYVEGAGSGHLERVYQSIRLL